MSETQSSGPAGRRPRRPGLTRCALVLGTSAAVAAGLTAAVPAQADDNRLTVGSAAERECAAGPATGQGVDSWTVTAPVSGIVEAKIAGQGDWDLAVIGPDGAPVAASAGFGGREVATGFVDAGTTVTIQGCLVSGAAGSVDVDLSFMEIEGEPETASLVEVSTPTRADKDRLVELGLDLTEHADSTSVTAVLHGAEDAETLRSNGFSFTTEVADLAAASAANREADAAYAAATEQSPLPSGRTSYRRLADYEAELKALAKRYPKLVKPITLAERTVEGREVHGIEITKDAERVHDGKPIFLNMGTHHAREWPAAEHSMEWAYQLLQGYGQDGELTDLVDRTRTIIVPVVNPDGFTISREAATTDTFGQFSYDMKRKNCSISQNTPEAYRVGECADNPAGRLRGTDLNRNYGGFWGGPGASTNWSSDTYRGDGPFSEPETRNVKQLVGTRSVTTLVTNHTYGNLWLRPPGVAQTRPPLDEPLYAALGAAATSHNDYANIPSYELYDTTGGAEDWTFWTAGNLGFTPEIGTEGFHEEYSEHVVAEYLGLPPAEGAGQGGNQGAYLEVQRATADSTYHSVITGKAPAGHTLKVRKEFLTATSPVVQPGGSVGEPILFEDELESTYATERGGRFSFAVNPSTRPVVAGRYGREPTGPAQPGTTLVNPPGIPDPNQDLDPAGPVDVATFTIEEGFDNAYASVTVDWGSGDSDWDVYVIGPDGDVVASAASAAEPEVATLRDPVPGEYTVYVFNYSQADPANPDDWTGSVSFRGPDPMEIGEQEAWTLTCTNRGGRLVGSQQVFVDRGETVDVGHACRGPRERKPRG